MKRAAEKRSTVLRKKAGNKLDAVSAATEAREDRAIYRAISILEKRMDRHAEVLSDPLVTRTYLRLWLAGKEVEHFVGLFLDCRHRLIAAETLSVGTLDAAFVYPREVAKHAIRLNAAAVIFGHNHPSGVTEPSEADKFLTTRLKHALALIDVRVLDHFVVGSGEPVSFSERGWL